MSYLLDSDIVADALKGQPAATTLVRRLEPQGLAISIITYSEIYEGTLRGPNRQGHQRSFRAFFRRARVLGVSRPVAQRYAEVRADLRDRKRPISHRALDLVIAATAIQYKLTLVTRNRGDYQDVTSLSLYPP